MSNLLKSPTYNCSIKLDLQFDKESRINIQSVQSSEEKGQNAAFRRDQQLDHSDCESPLKSHFKKTNSQKKIPHVFSQPKSMAEISLKADIGRYKDLLNTSDKRLADSLKRVALGSQTEKQSKKMRSFEIPFTFLSQSVDLVKIKNNEKSFTSAKMPDLLKIKLKKQLQLIQKNQKPKKPHFMRNHNKSHLKRESTPLVFLDCPLDRFEEQKRHEKAKQKARRNLINERKFNNFKKIEKNQRKQQISIKISHTKDTVDFDFKQWEKKSVTRETIDVNYLGNQRNQAKYSRLLEYVKKPGNNSHFESPYRRNSRIKTEAALYSSLIATDVNILELEGTKIREQPLKATTTEVSMMQIRSKLMNGKTTPVQTKPKLKMFNKLMNSECGTQPSRQGKYLFSKYHEISPWADLSQQCENGLD